MKNIRPCLSDRSSAIRRFRWLVGIALLLGISCALRADVTLGMRESDVLDDLGDPAGIITLGSRKQLTYRQGVITLVDGKVAKIDPAMSTWLDRRRRGDTSAAAQAVAADETAPAATGVPVQSPPAASEGPPTGRIPHFVLERRMFAEPATYFSGDVRQAWKESLKSSRNEPGTPDAAVAYPAGSQSAFVYVPKTYNRSKRFGVYVDLRPADVGGIPAGYEAICDQRELIWISPDAAGNDVHTARRCALALDALASIKRQYRIDDRRTYVGGFSGGGAIAACLTILYPDIFRAAFIHARGVYLEPVRTADHKIWLSQFPFLAPEQIRAVADQHQRVVFFTGPADTNYIHVQRTVIQWSALGFAVKGYEVPGLGHQDAPANAVNAALDWVESAP